MQTMQEVINTKVTEQKKILDEKNELLLKLEMDLKKIQRETHMALKDHLKELKRLKKILIQSSIKLENITWVLDTNIFDLMLEVPEEFSVQPLTMYKVLLACVKPFSKATFQKHLQVLLDRKNEETKDLLALINKEKNENKLLSKYKEEAQERISMMSSFFSVLYAEKERKRIGLEKTNWPRRNKPLRILSPLALTNKNCLPIEPKYSVALTFRSSR